METKKNLTVVQPLVTKLSVREPKKACASRAKRALRRQAGAAFGVGVVAATVTALSLHHLANGITIVTHAAEWESWSMAVGIDLGFVAMELAQILVMTDKVRRAIQRFTRPAIGGTLVGSAVMNGFAFGSQADGWVMMASGITLGAAIPALIYCLTRIGASLAMDCHSRA